MVTFKEIVENLVTQELQKQLKNPILMATVKWTETDNLFRSFEGRYRFPNTIGNDKTFRGFIDANGKISIML